MSKVSIIIATYNRHASLRKALDSLLKLEIPEGVSGEIIIVNNNSKDATKQFVESYLSKFNNLEKGREFPLKLRYKFEGRSGKAFALNTAISCSIGDYLIFTDDDVTFDNKWLSEIMRCFREFDCDGVGGRVDPVYPANTPQWIKETDKNRMSGVVVTYEYGEGDRAYSDDMDEFIGANYAFKRSVFDDCGHFMTDLSKMNVPVGEDREFIRRIIRKGKKLYYCGTAVIHHPVDLSRAKLRSAAKWNIALGRSAAICEQMEQPTMKALFGAPQYLWKGVIVDILAIIPCLFNRKALFFGIRRLFRKVGMIIEYRECGRKLRCKEVQSA